ncbi:MAG: hypothetical protein II978_02790 [Clostridia bacterium]|nr:hypothetical protein [Clostridia bacterium]
MFMNRKIRKTIKETEINSIRESATTSKPLICFTNRRKNQLIRMAKRRGLDIPTPINLNDLHNVALPYELSAILPSTGQTMSVGINQHGVFYLVSAFADLQEHIHSD